MDSDWEIKWEKHILDDLVSQIKKKLKEPPMRECCGEKKVCEHPGMEEHLKILNRTKGKSIKNISLKCEECGKYITIIPPKSEPKNKECMCGDGLTFNEALHPEPKTKECDVEFNNQTGVFKGIKFNERGEIKKTDPEPKTNWEDKIQKDLDNGDFGMICSSETHFKKYVFPILKSQREEAEHEGYLRGSNYMQDYADTAQQELKDRIVEWHSKRFIKETECDFENRANNSAHRSAIKFIKSL